MPVKPITDKFVRNVRLPNPEKGQRRQIAYLDTMQRGLALVLVVSYGGSKTFRALTYGNGKPHTIKLGTYPQMTVKEAREKARAYFADPATYAAQTLPDTFKEVADNWFKRHVEAQALRSAREIKPGLETYVYPKWKERKFLDLRRGEVNDLLDNIADHNGAQASRRGAGDRAQHHDLVPDPQRTLHLPNRQRHAQEQSGIAQAHPQRQ